MIHSYDGFLHSVRILVMIVMCVCEGGEDETTSRNPWLGVWRFEPRLPRLLVPE
jgi:hypothetical protein